MGWGPKHGNSSDKGIQDSPITTEELSRAGQEVGAIQNLEYRLPSGDPGLMTTAGVSSAEWLCEVLAWYGYHHMKAKKLDREDRRCIVS
jgi:hypothetical protein